MLGPSRTSTGPLTLDSELCRLLIWYKMELLYTASIGKILIRPSIDFNGRASRARLLPMPVRTPKTRANVYAEGATARLQRGGRILLALPDNLLRTLPKNEAARHKVHYRALANSYQLTRLYPRWLLDSTTYSIQRAYAERTNAAFPQVDERTHSAGEHDKARCRFCRGPIRLFLR